MESPPPDFLWGHPWTPPCYPYFPPSQPLLLAPRLRVIGDTSLFSSFSPPPPQLFASQLPSLLSLPSELCVQLNVTLLLLPAGLGATAPPRISAASLATAF